MSTNVIAAAHPLGRLPGPLAALQAERVLGEVREMTKKFPAPGIG
jgi:hypothetical protein